jgi:hypothetical protein
MSSSPKAKRDSLVSAFPETLLVVGRVIIARIRERRALGVYVGRHASSSSLACLQGRTTLHNHASAHAMENTAILMKNAFFTAATKAHKAVDELFNCQHRAQPA